MLDVSSTVKLAENDENRVRSSDEMTINISPLDDNGNGLFSDNF